ncbi:assimilatory nitrate reductase (NADH) alpha subunit apoprotein [Abditibacterium utsteinense]|uniref:Assimilatory nitrate reductase (NADH) alpha subunit apoprotein n=1 Tax=Abditibacterium utsteinense TaxID=1960156 RepID=A0A2S8SW38_9BACT|nr:molybdopterin oxidoreductase family protein [Abditibacterium utsteinense]PQV65004.1 assimilatory nitrate reductase (NADH) alpha subunit apoprotein [Abditibacterium utsteinense]
MTTATHCPYCALQCGMNLSPVRSNSTALVSVSTQQLEVQPRDFPTNRGGLCRKGWTSADLLHHPERLTSPLMRAHKGAPLEAVSWEKALDFVAAKFQLIQAQSGRDAIAVFGGGGLTNEKAYSLGKFARVALRTANIDYNGRYCMSSAAAANNKAFGMDRGLPFPLEDIAHAQTILLVGSNAGETMPPIMQWFEEQRENGGQLIVVDPRLTPTAESAALHLQITPGTDLALANGLLHIAIRDGLIDREFIASRTSGWDEARSTAAAYWPDRVERITGIPVADLEATVRALASAEAAMILSARGAEQHSKGTDTVLAFINLALALGKMGKPFCGYGCLTGQGNGQGGREHGQKADQLPGYRKIDDPAARAHMAQVWGVEESTIPGAGVSAWELIESLGTPKGPRALLVMGSNLVISSPRTSRVEEKLDSLDLLVCADIFLSETALLADVVFPITQWAEESGTMTNLEGRILLRGQAKEPPPGVRSDLDIMSELAKRLNCPVAFETEPQQVFEELRRASAGGIADYSGVSYQNIADLDGVFWPCDATTGARGTPRVFLEHFATPDGRARFHATPYRASAEEPCGEYPYFLTTGRVMAHYQSGTQTRRVRALAAMSGEAFVELHPDLAFELEIENGEMVRVLSRRGAVTVAARVVDSIRSDTLFLPFHWGGNGNANRLTNPALDPTSKMPEFKVCAARIEKILSEKISGEKSL